jgi:hypothetical protein
MEEQWLRSRSLGDKEVGGADYGAADRFSGGGVCNCIKVLSATRVFVWRAVKAEIDDDDTSWCRFPS